MLLIDWSPTWLLSAVTMSRPLTLRIRQIECSRAAREGLVSRLPLQASISRAVRMRGGMWGRETNVLEYANVLEKTVIAKSEISFLIVIFLLQ